MVNVGVMKDDRLCWLYLGCMGECASPAVFDRSAFFWAVLGFLVAYLSHVMIELPFAALTSMILPSKRASPKPAPLPVTDAQEPLTIDENVLSAAT